MVTGAGAPFGRKVVRPGVVLEVPSSKIQFRSTHGPFVKLARRLGAHVRPGGGGRRGQDGRARPPLEQNGRTRHEPAHRRRAL